MTDEALSNSQQAAAQTAAADIAGLFDNSDIPVETGDPVLIGTSNAVIKSIDKIELGEDKSGVAVKVTTELLGAVADTDGKPVQPGARHVAFLRVKPPSDAKSAADVRRIALVDASRIAVGAGTLDPKLKNPMASAIMHALAASVGKTIGVKLTLAKDNEHQNARYSAPFRS